MALEVTFRSGHPVMLDYTPASAVPAGQLVVVGELNLICHTAIPANILGAVAAGGGVYSGLSGGAITAGAKVFWDNTANRVTATATGNKPLGWLLPNSSASAAGQSVEFLHDPAA